MGEVELQTLRVRIIALENLLVALLASASKEQLAQTREIACKILPRPRATRHMLTVQAVTHMTNLVQRASRYRRRPD
jgi:hypothetical protein